jgi:hypothetical protein
MTILAPLGSFKPMDIENTEESSHPDDFDYQFRHYPGGGSVYVKLDINVKPETKSEAIEYPFLETKVCRCRSREAY